MWIDLACKPEFLPLKTWVELINSGILIVNEEEEGNNGRKDLLFTR